MFKITLRKSIFSAIAILMAGTAGFSAIAASEESHDAAVGRNLSIFNYIVKQLELNYVDSIRTDESFEYAINALLSDIDPYTEYYPASKQDEIKNMTTGEFGGIGSYIMQRDGSTYISEPMQGSPAAEAGLKAGDKIIRVDTINTIGKGSSEVTKLLRGQPSTSVRVEVLRPYATDSILSFDLVRRNMKRPSVTYSGMVSDSVGYIGINSFIDTTPDEVRDAITALKQNPKFSALILDLRGNGGGLLESAVNVVGQFVPKGTEVIRKRGKNGSGEKIYRTTFSPLLPDIPLTVLIDGASASAAEITAGAIQDLDRGVLLGTRSFGKGLVQNTLPLPYDGILKVTVGKYYLPSGRLLQAIDYSRRNPDGTIARTPDSLTNVFKTLHGREVRDGGGLTPDITLSWNEPSRILFNIVNDFWAFDYATKYAATHPTIPQPEVFEITDEIYEDFKKSIDPERFKYDKACEDMMKQLRSRVEIEGYLNDETKAVIDTLQKLLVHDLNHDLDTHRKDIAPYLADEILKRYYFDRGSQIYDLRSDIGVLRAIELFRNPEEYKKMLAPAKESDKK